MKKRLFIFCTFFLCSLLFAVYICYIENRHHIENSIEQEYAALQFQKSQAELKLQSIEEDLNFLVTSKTLQNFLYSSSSDSKKQLALELSNFVSSKKCYTQMRVISHEGKEILRIERDSISVKNISKSNLQNKSNRYYHHIYKTLQAGEVYVSPLDLNIEHDTLESPHKPTFRMLQPLYKGTVPFGYLVLNVNGKAILNLVQKSSNPHAQTFLVNNDGELLYSNSPEYKAWEFIITPEKSNNAQARYPNLWEQIQSSNSGTFQTKNEVTLYTTIFPTKKTGNNQSQEVYWKCITSIPTSIKSCFNIYTSPHYIIITLIFSLLASILYIRQKEKRERAHNDATNAYALLQEQNQALEKAIETKNTFFSIIAHDLRNPFQVVIGYTSVLIKNFQNMKDDEIKEYFADIETATGTLLQLLENLLQWSRSQTNQIQFRPHVHSLRDLSSEAVKITKLSAQKKDITIENRVHEEDIVYADKYMVHTIIRNLLTNSIKFTENGGHITLNSNRLSHNTTELTLSDTGVGMTEGECHRLFHVEEKFSKEGTGGEKGTGLGLLLVHEFITKNSGTIAVNSKKGEGTTFIMTFLREPL